MTSRVLNNAQYHRQHCTLHPFEQLGSLYMHSHDDKYPARPRFEPGSSRLQAPVTTYHRGRPTGSRGGEINQMTLPSHPGFEIRVLSVWGRARYPSVTDPPPPQYWIFTILDVRFWRRNLSQHWRCFKVSSECCVPLQYSIANRLCCIAHVRTYLSRSIMGIAVQSTHSGTRIRITRL